MRKLPLRDRLWDKSTSRLNEGEILPRWAVALRCVLFPCAALTYFFGDSRNYSICSDIWTICGGRFPGRTLRRLALSNGELYRVHVEDGTVRIMRATIPVHAPSLGPETIVDVEQVVYALQRAERRLQWQADQLHDEGDYAAETPAEDAQRMREAIALLLATPATPQPSTPGA
jgi:hypothetical protein